MHRLIPTALLSFILVGCGQVGFDIADGSTDGPASDTTDLRDNGVPSDGETLDGNTLSDAGDDAGPPSDAGDAGDAGDVPPSDAGDDAGPSDAGDDAPPEDSGPPDPLMVINTSTSGAGSLTAAIEYANTTCIGPMTISFDIPPTDVGYLPTAVGGNYWSIEGPVPLITCPATIIDGATQTSRRGNTNPKTFGGMPVGAAGVALGLIQGPEVMLRGVSITVGTTDVVLRGLGIGAILGNMIDGLLVEDCVIGGEVWEAAAVPMVERRADAVIFYAENCPGCIVRRSVIVASNGSAGTPYNVFSYRGNSAGAVLRDSLFAGAMVGAGSWDEVHMNPANDVRIIHNYLGTQGMEFHVEWVPGFGGEISENTFVGPAPTISMGGAATMSGNITVP